MLVRVVWVPLIELWYFSDVRLMAKQAPAGDAGLSEEQAEENQSLANMHKAVSARSDDRVRVG